MTEMINEVKIAGNRLEIGFGEVVESDECTKPFSGSGEVDIGHGEMGGVDVVFCFGRFPHDVCRSLEQGSIVEAFGGIVVDFFGA